MVGKPTPGIMVLDDDPFMLKLLSRMLANQGLSCVTTCDCARAALERLDSMCPPPDLLLLDLNMPEVDGVEFMHQLVKRNYAGSLILVSGEDERILQAAEKLAKAHRLTVLGCLNKPVKPEELAVLIGKLAIPSQDKPLAAMKVYDANQVRAAITNGELVNYYQPKIEVKTAKVAGVETLVRWRHPVDGIVFPDAFIGVAEEHDLINDLTRVVMADALAQAKVWQKEGIALQLAINVSMDNLISLDFVDFVVRQTAAAGVAPQDLVLEVTESRLMGDLRIPLEILTRLRLKRFQLSIDDFGTGHSSLLQLSNIPFNELKVDRRFVHGVRTNQTSRAIYDASLQLANQLGMKVVAEGVEDRDDWDFLRQTGCDLAQGFFIARPMPAGDLPGWIKDWREKAKEWLPDNK